MQGSHCCIQAVHVGEAERKAAAEQQMAQRQRRSQALRQAHLTEIRQKAGDETKKVHEVQFINSLQNQDRKLCLKQRLEVRQAFDHKFLHCCLVCHIHSAH